jgi:hypothetical protein
MGGHVTRAVEMRTIQNILAENPKGRDHLGYEGIHGRVVIKWSLSRA